MTIVCVDNTPIMLQSLKDNADKAYPHADVQTFLNAEPALEYAEKFGCDVLLCEINPPRLEGLFLAERIKNINPKVNIIFVTVCSESEHAKAVMRLKPSGYLTKEATSAPDSGRIAESAVSDYINKAAASTQDARQYDRPKV